MKKSVNAFIILLFLSALQINAEEPIKRYLLVVGANDGGRERITLKYAVSDAASFRDVLINLGGVSEKDAFAVYNPDKRNFYSAMNKLKTQIDNDKDRYRKRELFFYYSGHSDETGILLGNEKVTYKDLKDSITEFDVDVRIAILDSCSSGAFTRTKGGEMKPAFLVDSSYDMKGNAFMTSSSADEASQESDRIRGSFFTHYVLAGMRGAADVSQDKKITLNEVYQFAYNSTLARTQTTSAGPQHPNYHIEMIGTGDVVLTDINKSNSKLLVENSIEGKLLIADLQGRPVAEFNKSYGQEVSLGIPSGTYNVTNNRYNNTVESAKITVPSSSSYTLAQSDFSGTSTEQTRSRGSYDEPEFFNEIDERMNYLLGPDDSGGGEYLFRRGDLNFSGYGGPATIITGIANEPGVFTGGKGGMILNDTFVFGGGGYGMVNPLQTSAYTGDQVQIPDTHTYVGLGFGGFLFEYYFMPKNLVTYSVGGLIGGGGLTFIDNLDSENSNNTDTQSFFAMYPSANAYINVTRFFRIGAGVGYLFFGGIDSEYVSDSDFNGVTLNLVFQFGWF
jgi:hypothetical protein